MPAVYEVRYSDGRVEQLCGIRGLYYELPDGESLDVDTDIAWCKPCDKLTDVEHLKAISLVEQELADMRNPDSDLYRMFFHSPSGEKTDFLQSQIADAARRKACLMVRESPPKCLHCGSIDLMPTPYGFTVKHAHEYVTFCVECIGMCSTNFMNWFYTPEGDRIERVTKPSYWHHPSLDRDTNP